MSSLKTRLGWHHDNDEFWSTVVRFLVNNAMIDPTWVGPIVDYIFNMKFVSRRIVQEGGGIEEGPPPQPNFTMKGRSAAKLLRQVEAWHGRKHLVSCSTNRTDDQPTAVWHHNQLKPLRSHGLDW
jgi:hypothetical protein